MLELCLQTVCQCGRSVSAVYDTVLPIVASEHAGARVLGSGLLLLGCMACDLSRPAGLFDGAWWRRKAAMMQDELLRDAGSLI